MTQLKKVFACLIICFKTIAFSKKPTLFCIEVDKNVNQVCFVPNDSSVSTMSGL